MSLGNRNPVGRWQRLAVLLCFVNTWTILLVPRLAWAGVGSLAAGGEQSDARIALVIGNGAYQHSPTLKAPTRDALDVAAALEGVGFEVTLVLDADRGEMMTAIKDFGDAIDKKRPYMAFAYYSGHGAQVDGTNFLLPVDADIRRANEIPSETVDLNSLLGQMPEVHGRLNIVVLDACRNNPFPASVRSADQGLAQVSTVSGTLLAYATAPGSVAFDSLDSSDRNSPYTAALLTHIQREGLQVEQVFKAVREDVSTATKRRQVPWVSDSVIGDFYFVPPVVIVEYSNPDLATITVYSELGGELFLDGKSHGEIEPFGQRVLTGILPGEHLIEIGGERREVIVGAGEEVIQQFKKRRPVEREGAPMMLAGGTGLLLGAGAVGTALLIASPWDGPDNQFTQTQISALIWTEIVGYGLIGAGTSALVLGQRRFRLSGAPGAIALQGDF